MRDVATWVPPRNAGRPWPLSPVSGTMSALTAAGMAGTYLGVGNYVASGASAIVVSSLFNGLEVRTTQVTPAAGNPRPGTARQPATGSEAGNHPAVQSPRGSQPAKCSSPPAAAAHPESLTPSSSQV